MPLQAICCMGAYPTQYVQYRNGTLALVGTIWGNHPKRSFRRKSGREAARSYGYAAATGSDTPQHLIFGHGSFEAVSKKKSFVTVYKADRKGISQKKYFLWESDEVDTWSGR